MNFTVRSKRRQSSRTGPSISLFPFLAVLICMMGAMVPLLLVITRTAQRQAEAAALAKAAEQAAQARTQREDVQWRIEQLKRSRQLTKAQLADARLELGHFEDHWRRLRTQLAQYEKTMADFDRLENVDHRQRTQAQTELERIRAQIDAARRQVAEARQTAMKRNRSYAVVPYEGPNQTHRRPIYIECRQDAVVLQPEGVELTEADFNGPLGPGNPLAAALRAARQYMLAQRGFDPQAGEPYPLLLVRPEGVNAYYAARAAMKSWAGDFGYELIGDDWKLAYQPPDPRLAEVVRQVVVSARASQAQLIAAAPRHYNNRSKTTYRASSTGGFVRERRVVRDEGRGARGEGRGTWDGGSPYNPRPASAESPGTAVSEGGSGLPTTAPSGSAAANAISSITRPHPNPLPTNLRSVPGEGIERPNGYIVGQPPREHETSNQLRQSSGSLCGRVLRPGEWEPPSDLPPEKKRDDRQGDDRAGKKGGRHGKSLAAKRGKDWGLRDAARGSVGVTRPIRVECRTDRLVVISDCGPDDDKVVPLGPRAESSIDTFISAVWEHMEWWGIAGRSMYWRPLLQVSVAPDAERRFVELSALLEGSGLRVERK